MGVSDRKQKATESLRQRVLDEAETIMAREGSQQVTMRRIAACVDYAPTVLYRLFADKDDLMDHLIARGYSGVRRRYAEVLSRKGQEPLQTLVDILSAYVAYAIDHSNHYRMWFDTGEISFEDGQLKMRHGRLEFVVFQTWLDCIEECCKAGCFPGFVHLEVFQLLWSRVHGLISLRLQHPGFPWMAVERQIAGVVDLKESIEA